MSARSPITFTLDLEDHRPSKDVPVRFTTVTRQILEWLDGLDVRGTVFAVGEDAEAHPDLIRDVVAGGHELGLHGWAHTALTELDPTTFRDDAKRGKALLEDLGGREVTGFRAPMFSLVPDSQWATDVLVETGFTYSSSVLPARNPLFGDPACPQQPFEWPNGLLELPAPVGGVGPAKLPYLGGVYLRTLPLPVIRSLHAVHRRAALPWVYCHPYDFDPGEPMWRVPEVGRFGNQLLWYNRRNTFTKVERLLRSRVGAPLGERVAQARAEVRA